MNDKKENPFLEDIRDTFAATMSRQKLKKRELAHRLGITPETLRYKLDSPGRFTVGEYRIACLVLNLNPKTLSNNE